MLTVSNSRYIGEIESKTLGDRIIRVMQVICPYKGEVVKRVTIPQGVNPLDVLDSLKNNKKVLDVNLDD